jgi:molybdate transport system substrate-binding protein
MRLLASVMLVLLGAAACGDGGGDEAGGRTLTVLAAASVGDAVEEVAQLLEADHEGLDVVVSTDGSSALVAAVLEGAPADVLITADEPSTARVVDAGLVAGEPRIIATNGLQIVVPAGNPLDIGGLDDLDGISLALCQPQVPCGAYAVAAFEQAGLAVPSAGEEGSVTAVLTRVQLGEADAGLVYVTDVLGASDVEGVALGGEPVVARYPAAVLRDAADPDLARELVELLAGAEGQAVLQRHGFGAP